MEALRIKIRLRSLVGIVFDRYSGVNDQNDQEAFKNAALKLYRDEHGSICLPANNLKASIREASGEIGKKTESKVRRNAIRAGLFFFPDLIPLCCEVDGNLIAYGTPDGIHAEHVTRRGSGGKVTRVVSYRPYLKAWECGLEAIVYGISPENLHQYLELAGLRYGLCGHRPEWGRFEVTQFEVVV